MMCEEDQQRKFRVMISCQQQKKTGRVGFFLLLSVLAEFDRSSCCHRDLPGGWEKIIYSR